MPPRTKLNLNPTATQPQPDDRPHQSRAGEAKTNPTAKARKSSAAISPKPHRPSFAAFASIKNGLTQTLLEEALADLFAKYRNRA